MDRYAPELSMLRLKRRRGEDQECNHYPPAKKIAQITPPLSNFMRLPAELRNRVYNYATSEAPSQLLVPVESFQLQQQAQRATGIAMTQVSRQIRSEYRPMWLKHTTFVIDWHSIHAFLQAFYPKESDYDKGPKELILQYDQEHDYTFRKPTDITHLVRLGLAFAGLQIRFIQGEESDDQSDAGNALTELVQFGCINRDDRQKDNNVAAEAKRTWRQAIQERTVTNIFATQNPSDNTLVFEFVLSTKFALEMNAVSLQDIGKEIELRNRVYDLAAKTQADLPRCVLPCLALAQACQQLRIGYRPICIKQDIIIDWQKIPGYMRTFFPTVNGKIENIELIPSSMTIVTPWCGEAGKRGLQLDILPMIKVGLRQPDFTCNFIHYGESLEKMEVPPYIYEDYALGYSTDMARFLQEDNELLRIIMNHRSEEWTSGIETGRITKILLSNIGVNEEPQALFHVNIHGLSLENEPDDLEEQEMNTEYACFERVGLLDIWPDGFVAFLSLSRVEQSC
ncbi:hypothetical protein AG0111_0g8037 [Alternaria gaisen]|uniref:Uncharacterized protein n=1 Tax=Alternaria gaisen TaxID=167740 RepID=A0ACB6FFR1_9PLEO|nr:hypothetical protein AG0111_0g8037 [Alternaria gaisen]